MHTSSRCSKLDKLIYHVNRRAELFVWLQQTLMATTTTPTGNMLVNALHVGVHMRGCPGHHPEDLQMILTNYTKHEMPSAQRGGICCTRTSCGAKTMKSMTKPA